MFAALKTSWMLPNDTVQTFSVLRRLAPSLYGRSGHGSHHGHAPSKTSGRFLMSKTFSSLYVHTTSFSATIQYPKQQQSESSVQQTQSASRLVVSDQSMACMVIRPTIPSVSLCLDLSYQRRSPQIRHTARNYLKRLTFAKMDTSYYSELRPRSQCSDRALAPRSCLDSKTCNTSR